MFQKKKRQLTNTREAIGRPDVTRQAKAMRSSSFHFDTSLSICNIALKSRGDVTNQLVVDA